jgi:hypothetical protein
MPGVARSLVVLTVGWFGDRVRDLLDPRALSWISGASRSFAYHWRTIAGKRRVG